MQRSPAPPVKPSGLPRPRGKDRLGSVVALSMVAGLVAAAVLVAVPLFPAEEHVLTGVGLLGFALGWALLVVLSRRVSHQPQSWAAAPATFMAVTGVVSLSGSTVALEMLSWVWPPVLLGLVGWMFLRVRRGLRRRKTRWLVYPVLAGLALASVGGGYETVAERRDAAAYPAPGELVDVGGHRLHLRCVGEGSPTVVLEPGLGGTSSGLGWIAPAVAGDSRVCVYDRAGRGWSEPADGPQDAARIAADLHTLLERTGERGPYVLAGHSFGGLYVLSFAAQFPDQVAGLVLLDSTAPQPGPVPASGPGSTLVDRVAALVPAAAHLGVGRLIAQFSYASLPADSRDAARANASTARSLASVVEEFLEGSASVREAASLTDLRGKPLLVLTADTGHDAQWRAAQNQLASLSVNRLHRVAHATHTSLIDDERDSAAASQAIHDLVVAVRTSTPLPPR